tara:strand:+ start:40 stop:426 length:387 start_codon:yes stop_codon:yes gene_type:complete
MNDKRLLEIVEKMREVRGLKPIAFLSENHKKIVKNIEESNNDGVLKSLKREHTLLLAHDSSFREPLGDIVKFEEGNLRFPGIAFPEVDADNVVSSSPSLKVHNTLIDELEFCLNSDDATLLVGFDLKK